MINTYSRFIYDFVVDKNFYSIKFSEGANTFRAEVDIGSYSMSEFAKKIAQALNNTGENEYFCVVDRETRKFTINSPQQFSLIVVGEADSILYKMNITDVNNVTSVTSSLACGKIYDPQMWLQSYVPTTIYKKAAFSTVNKSASGIVQVQKFGNESFMECNIRFITDIAQNSVIKTNLSGLQDTIDFMDYLIQKYPVEFEADLANHNVFEEFILESTEDDSNGVGYKLKEMYAMGLPNYYETGILKMRKL